jgi:hypothetical protein
MNPRRVFTFEMSYEQVVNIFFCEEFREKSGNQINGTTILPVEKIKLVTFV